MLTPEEYEANGLEDFRSLLCDPGIRALIAKVGREVAETLFMLGFASGTKFEGAKNSELIEALLEATKSEDVVS